MQDTPTNGEDKSPKVVIAFPDGEHSTSIAITTEGQVDVGQLMIASIMLDRYYHQTLDRVEAQQMAQMKRLVGAGPIDIKQLLKKD